MTRRSYRMCKDQASSSKFSIPGKKNMHALCHAVVLEQFHFSEAPHDSVRTFMALILHYCLQLGGVLPGSAAWRRGANTKLRCERWWAVRVLLGRGRESQRADIRLHHRWWHR